MFRPLSAASIAAVLTALLSTSSAHADPVVVGESHTETVGPNMALITSGLFTFGVPYVGSMIVAAESTHPGDQHLWVPVAGPWLDFANRGSCPPSAGGCDWETTTRVILVADGVLQAAGALQILGGFIFPERRIVATVPATAYTPAMTISPARLAADGYGLAAIGRF